MTPVGRPLTRLRAAFNEAEGFAREVGELRSNVPVPAYNQLRYAGYHLLKALDDDAQVVNEPEINKAVGHCERAMYDAAEAGIIQALRELAAFRYEYRFLNISPCRRLRGHEEQGKERTTPHHRRQAQARIGSGACVRVHDSLP